jgi:hypothetical protein
LITQRFGIYAAKELLGHSDISVTAAHYSEAKGKPTVGMGDLLKTPANVIPIGSAQADFGPEESMGSSGQTPVFSN